MRQQARRELLAGSRKHAITAKLRQIPSLGPIRCALAVALIQTPHRSFSNSLMILNSPPPTEQPAAPSHYDWRDRWLP